MATEEPTLVRQTELERVRKLYPDRVIIVISAHGPQDPVVDKSKYVVPRSLTFGNFISVVRKRMKLTEEHALFFFVNNTLVPNSHTVHDVCRAHGAGDDVLYVRYSTENAFG